jgi:probable rRNA maturation factor
MSELVLRNRQRVRAVNTLLLRRIVRSLLTDFVGVENYELGLHLLSGPQITRLNETFLRHAGSTDVITFDYSEFGTRNSELLSIHGEVFVCVDEAARQARRFRTTWQSELVRYIVHGVLHLLGHDDQRPAARRKMKREENRLLRDLAACFPLSQLARRLKLRA